MISNNRNVSSNLIQSSVAGLITAITLLITTSCGASQPSASEMFFDASTSELEASKLFLSHKTPALVGLDEELLQNILSQYDEGTFGNLDSLIIIKDDEIVVERYFGEQTRDRLHPIHSVTKSVSSILIGIAIDKGLIEGVDIPLLEFFPEYSSVENMDARKREITLQDVLTMRPGFSWNDPGGDHSLAAMGQSRDMIEYMLNRPMAVQPGRVWKYNTGNSLLMSGILRNRTGNSAQQFAEEELFGPLGITEYQWAEASEGLSNSGSGIQLKPLDMAKLGYLFLNNGQWQGEQIVSQDWIDQSTHAFVYFTQYTSYGYQWWTISHQGVDGHTPTPNDIWYAVGAGGQYIFVIPLTNMVVVMTATNYGDQTPVKRQEDTLFLSILNAVLN
jgi:CubicO group peptidase (beta-lactamase class C family)